MGAWNWFKEQFITRPGRIFLLGMILYFGGGATSVYGQRLGPRHAGLDLLVAGVVLICVSALIGLLKLIRKLMPEGAKIATAVAIEMALCSFFFLLPLVLVALVTSGGNWSLYSSGAYGPVAELTGWARLGCQLVFLIILPGLPTALRGYLPWNVASGLARALVPSWLAAAAAVMTWLYVVLLHFGGSVLAGYPLGLIMVGGIGAAVLLTPLYQFLARSCWQHGITAVFDPTRWLKAFRTVFDEIRLGPHSQATGEFRPGSPDKADAGPTETLIEDS